jgi:hypothetical protein
MVLPRQAGDRYDLRVAGYPVDRGLPDMRTPELLLLSALATTILSGCAIHNTSRVVQLAVSEPDQCIWVAVDEFTGTGQMSLTNNAPAVTEDLVPYHDELFRCCPASKDPTEHPVCIEARWARHKQR